jgi:hypothetical protein
VTPIAQSPCCPTIRRRHRYDPLPSQLRPFVCACIKLRAESFIIILCRRVDGGLRFRRPNLPSLLLLLLPVIHQRLADSLLEKDRPLSYIKSVARSSNLQRCAYPLLVGVQLSRSEHIGIHVPLCTLAEILVFFKYLPVKVADGLKLLVGSVLVAIYFVLDLTCCG